MEAIVKEHMAFIRWVVRSMGVRKLDREDVMQQILHAISSSLGRFDPLRGSLRGWLAAIVFHHVSNHHARVHRRREVLQPIGVFNALPDGMKDSEELLIEANRRQLLDKLLSEIPPERREVLVAHLLHDTPMDQVAEDLQIPENTAWNRLRLGRADLVAVGRRWLARQRGRGLPLVLLPVDGGGWFEKAQELGKGFRRAIDRLRSRLERRGRAAGGGLPARWSPRGAGGRLFGAVAGAALASLLPVSLGNDPAQDRSVADVATTFAEIGGASGDGGQRETLSSSGGEPAPGSGSVQASGAAPAGATIGRSSGDRGGKRPWHALERRLIQQAVAARTAGRRDDALRLLERHRREFADSPYARDRETLLENLGVGRTAGRVEDRIVR